ncbi:serine hydrolase domain-containing protein [Undibacterium sp. Xuan67W]|uniref:serine hydrolase domain-containing protein n=1 Tax=Undibacterium sp. Xuan67W TaxID=3413057 RepID=UPI003BEF59A7
MKRKCLSRLLLASSIALTLPAQFSFAADVVASASGKAAPSQVHIGKLEQDLGLVTQIGTQVTGPRDWSVRRDSNMLVLDAPEADTHVALIDLEAENAAAAVKAAWLQYKPGEKHPVNLVTNRAAKDGWEERKVSDYETSPNERIVIEAIAHRRGKQWSVVLLDGSEQTFEKRGAAISLIVQSVRPAGYTRESFAGRTPHHMDASRVALLRSFLSDSMKLLGVPGASFAVLDGGKVVYEGGVGVRELGKPAPVDANTLFMAASNTKGMSTLMLSSLADEGKLKWDQPVTQLYPGFKLGDAETTQKVLFKHLICACTGLPRQDLEWIFEYKNATPESSLALLATNKPTSGFGDIFQYNNLMASAAGYIGGHLAYPEMSLGAAYDLAMQKRIFDPLGMSSTTFDMAKALKGNHASPHGMDVNGKTTLAGMEMNYSIMPHRPAGGVWTTAHDFIRYVKFEADTGKVENGKQYISADNVLARRQPQVSVGENATYGMGLETEVAWGVPVVFHGGSMFGFKSNFYLLPDSGIGVALLTNSDEGGRLLRPFMRRFMEIVFDGKPEAVEDIKAAVATTKAGMTQFRDRLVMPAATQAASKLAKRYQSPELGELIVSKKGRDTVFDFGEWKSVVASRKNDDGSISFITTEPTRLGFEMVVGERHGKRVLITRDGQHEYVFTEGS